MKCGSRDIKELLPLYGEQALDGDATRRVEQHLETCLDCREELALLRAMASEPVPDPGEAFWSRMPSQVYRQVQEQAEKSRGSRWSGILQGLLMPRWAWASAAVLVIAAAAWLLVRPHPEAPTVASSSGLTLEDEYLPGDTVDIDALGADEIKGVDSWANREMNTLAAEAGSVMTNGRDANIEEELAELDGRSLERLSRMLDQLRKGGQG